MRGGGVVKPSSRKNRTSRSTAAARSSRVTAWISACMALSLAGVRLANNCSRATLAAMARLPLTPFPRAQPRPSDEEVRSLTHKTIRRPDAASARAWQRMLSGRRLDLLDPSALDIEIEDIAHGLARVARWNGQTKGAHIFSVAQHSLLVEAVARARVPRLDRGLRLAILLHDAPEYVIGDMISPFTPAVPPFVFGAGRRSVWVSGRPAGVRTSAPTTSRRGRRP